MERLTGKQAQSLAEAYAAVYTSQELTEEQVWEGVEEWVNALLEEGYDLSDYTWEEMYEDYLNEGSSEANPPSAAEARKDEADPRRNQAPTRSSQYGSEANPPSAADAKKAEEDPRKPGTPDPRFPTPFERRRRNLETGSRKSGESLADFAKRQSQNLEKDFPSTAATAATPNTAERSTAAATPNTAGAPAKPSPPHLHLHQHHLDHLHLQLHQQQIKLKVEWMYIINRDLLVILRVLVKLENQFGP
jgi:hypothetical protein